MLFVSPFTFLTFFLFWQLCYLKSVVKVAWLFIFGRLLPTGNHKIHGASDP